MITFVPWRLGHSNLAIDALTSLELTGGLRFCLDPGDADSYGGSGQVWADVSGNGYDFLFGASASAEGSDPEFVGSAGALDAYMAFDGGDFFTYESANEAWMNRLHQNNALFSLFGYVYFGAASFWAIGGTGRNNVNDIGISFRRSSGDKLRFSVENGSGTLAFGVNSTAELPTDAWVAVGVSIDEAAGEGFLLVDGVAETISPTYASPSASDADYTFQIGADGDGSNPLPDGSRLGPFLAWEGVALTAAQMSVVFDATRGRFNL